MIGACFSVINSSFIFLCILAYFLKEKCRALL
nr:MAG TPA: hypothetical protein [Caudoviricetes sp.]